jgi:hypothetical protein
VADIDAALRTRLTAHAGTQALVSSRVWYDHLPPKPILPAATVGQISGVRPKTMGSDTDVVQGRVQVDSCASSRAGAVALAEQVKGALKRFRGTSGGVTINACFLEDETPAFLDADNIWTIQHDYMVTWRE